MATDESRGRRLGELYNQYRDTRKLQEERSEKTQARSPERDLRWSRRGFGWTLYLAIQRGIQKIKVAQWNLG